MSDKLEYNRQWLKDHPERVAEYRKRAKKRVENMTPEQIEKKRADRKASYRRNRERILAERRARYANDPEHREKCKRYSRDFYKHPDRLELAKGQRARRRAYYWKDPVRWRSNTREWQLANRERHLRRMAQKRAEKRDQLRANAKREALLLTDSYVRNQLSKYSTKSTREWTEDEVQAKREHIIELRERRVGTKQNAAEIRNLYASGRSVRVLARLFGLSVSMIYLIVANKYHVDPCYAPPRINQFHHVSRVFRLLAASGAVKAR